MKEGTEGSKSPLPVEQRIAESEAATSAAKAELDAAEAELKASKAREAATEVSKTEQAAPTDEDGYKTPNGTENEHDDAAPATISTAETDTAQIPQPGLAELLRRTQVTTAETDLPPTIGEHDIPTTYSPEIEPAGFCPNLGTAACLTTAIIGVVAMAAASM